MTVIVRSDIRAVTRTSSPRLFEPDGYVRLPASIRADASLQVQLTHAPHRNKAENRGAMPWIGGSAVEYQVKPQLDCGSTLLKGMGQWPKDMGSAQDNYIRFNRTAEPR